MAISNIGALSKLTMKLDTTTKTAVDALDRPETDAIGLGVTYPSAANTVGFGTSTGKALFGVIVSYNRHTGLAAIETKGVVAAKLSAALTYASPIGVNDDGELLTLAAGNGIPLTQDTTALTAEILL